MTKIAWSLVVSRNDQGFTLLEVMIAIAIIATALVTLLKAQNQNLRALTESADLTTATLLAKQKLAEVEIGGFPDLAEEAGNFSEGEFSKFRWRRTVAPTPFDRLREVTVQVFWEERKGVREVTLFLFVADRRPETQQR